MVPKGTGAPPGNYLRFNNLFPLSLMHFVAIDFETATSAYSSACEIGLTRVENGKVVASEAWLIKPPQYPHFQPINISIHGIRPEDVAAAPTFAELWPELQPWLTDCVVVAHNAGFDMGVLRRTLEAYDLPAPVGLRYACTVQMARRVWTDLGTFKLNTLCQAKAIDLPRHHRAAGDARACAELLLRAAADTECRSVAELAARGVVRLKAF